MSIYTEQTPAFIRGALDALDRMLSNRNRPTHQAVVTAVASQPAAAATGTPTAAVREIGSRYMIGTPKSIDQLREEEATRGPLKVFTLESWGE
jgi:hypothetical protein